MKHVSTAHRQSHFDGKGLAVLDQQRLQRRATLLPAGSTLLLCRVQDRRGLSHFGVARSANGVDAWQIDREPTLRCSRGRTSGGSTTAATCVARRWVLHGGETKSTRTNEPRRHS